VETILSLITHMLGEYTKLGIAAIIFVTSVRQFALKNSSPIGRNFIKFNTQGAYKLWEEFAKSYFYKY